MLEASIRAVTDLLPFFAVSSVLITLFTIWISRSKKWPVTWTTLCSVSLLGALSVTLLPGNAGDAGKGIVCAVGPSLTGMLSTIPGQLNVLLFAPACFFGVCAFGRPITVLSGGAILASAIELLQAVLPLGRSCSYSDIIANTLGVATGVLCGVGCLAAERARTTFTRRDVVSSLRLIGFGGTLIFGAFWLGIAPVHGGPEAVGATNEQKKWAREVAAEVYGQHSEIVRIQRREASLNSPAKIQVATSKGNLTLLWPDRKILSAFSVDNQDDGGSLTPGESRAAAETFASKWYAEELEDCIATFDPLAEGGAPYVLSYRRYRDGVMMPLRIDITVTSSGRIMGVNARLAENPDLPKPVIDKATAEERAKALMHLEPGKPVFLIAKEVQGNWRPVWIVNMIRAGERESRGAVVYIDAVSGELVERRD